MRGCASLEETFCRPLIIFVGIAALMRYALTASPWTWSLRWLMSLLRIVRGLHLKNWGLVNCLMTSACGRGVRRVRGSGILLFATSSVAWSRDGRIWAGGLGGRQVGHASCLC